MRRGPLSAVMAAALAGAGVLCGVAPSAHAADPPPARAVRSGPATVTAADATTVPLRLEPLGDSITWGEASSTGNGYRDALAGDLTGDGYTLDFVGSMRSGTMSDPDNEGHQGWRIDQIAALADTTLATYKPNLVTLMLGTNDLIQGYQVPTAPDRLHALVDRVLADDPTATVLLADLPPSTSPQVAQAEPAYDAAVRDIVASEQAAGRHVGFVDMGALTTADLADQVHPNDTGYRKMADAWHAGVRAAASAGWLRAPQPVTGVLKSGMAGKCLDLNAGSAANGTPVQLWTCNGTVAQVWTSGQDGTVRAQGKCLDVTGAATGNGSPVELWDCNGGGNQQWQPYNGGLRNPASGRCLDDPAFSVADGTRLQLWDCNGGTNQQWSLA
ncbi:ricin-type beta-trefoil lectin domain protein [Actinacidiphila alni]|uniref:ricin-type beta-trefoil lectin domain protein n=1 Tax=Actinacidiphila alni TaxID=380248 RepID=UPI0034566050